MLGLIIDDCFIGLVVVSMVEWWNGGTITTMIQRVIIIIDCWLLFIDDASMIL